jgi:hypothetical protein
MTKKIDVSKKKLSEEDLNYISTQKKKKASKKKIADIPTEEVSDDRYVIRLIKATGKYKITQFNPKTMKLRKFAKGNIESTYSKAQIDKLRKKGLDVTVINKSERGKSWVI